MSKRTIKQYTLEFKQSSARLASSSDQSILKTAKELGISSSTLHSWVYQYCPATPKTTHMTSESAAQLEIKQLKKALARALQERDILKKATAYFAKLAE